MNETLDNPPDGPKPGDIVEWETTDDDDFYQGRVLNVAHNGVLKVQALDGSGTTRYPHMSEVRAIVPQADIETVEGVGRTAITVGEGITQPEPVNIPVTVVETPAEIPAEPQAPTPPTAPNPEMTQAQEVEQTFEVVGSVLSGADDTFRNLNEAYSARAQELGVPVKDLSADEMNRVRKDVLAKAQATSQEQAQDVAPPAASVPVEREATVQPTTYDSPKRGVWHSSGPQGQDNPEADVVGEVSHTDGRKFYRMRHSDGSGNDWYAPADEVEIVAEATAPEPEPEPEPEQSQELGDDKEAAPAPDFEAKVLNNLQESIHKSQEDISRLEQLIQGYIDKAKQAMDKGRFDDAAELVSQSKARQKELISQKDRLRYLLKRYKLTKDILNPANILDLKEKIDNKIKKEQDRRDRFQDKEPMDDYINMVKRYLIDAYVQTGADPSKPRSISEDLIQAILANISLSYGQLQNKLPKSRPAAASPPTPPPAPVPTPPPAPAAPALPPAPTAPAPPAPDDPPISGPGNYPEHDSPIGPPIPEYYRPGQAVRALSPSTHKVEDGWTVRSSVERDGQRFWLVSKTEGDDELFQHVPEPVLLYWNEVKQSATKAGGLIFLEQTQKKWDKHGWIVEDGMKYLGVLLLCTNLLTGAGLVVHYRRKKRREKNEAQNPNPLPLQQPGPGDRQVRAEAV